LSADDIGTPPPFHLDRQISHEFGIIELRGNSVCMLEAIVLCKAKGFLYVFMGDVFAVHNTCQWMEPWVEWEHCMYQSTPKAIVISKLSVDTTTWKCHIELKALVSQLSCMT